MRTWAREATIDEQPAHCKGLAATTLEAMDFGGANLTPLTLLLVVVLDAADSRLGGFLTVRFFFPPSSPAGQHMRLPRATAWLRKALPPKPACAARSTCKSACERQCDGGWQDDNRVEDPCQERLVGKADRQLVPGQVSLDLRLDILDSLGQCPASLQDLHDHTCSTCST